MLFIMYYFTWCISLNGMKRLKQSVKLGSNMIRGIYSQIIVCFVNLLGFDTLASQLWNFLFKLLTLYMLWFVNFVYNSKILNSKKQML